jgi:hypothetical protein
MGAVYRAEHLLLGKAAAVKVCRRYRSHHRSGGPEVHRSASQGDRMVVTPKLGSGLPTWPYTSGSSHNEKSSPLRDLVSSDVKVSKHSLGY